MMNTMIRCEECFYREDANIPNAIYCKLYHETFSLPMYACENGRVKTPKPKTRGDKIRGMTNAELRDEFFHILKHVIRSYNDDYMGLLDWLNEEAK